MAAVRAPAMVFGICGESGLLIPGRLLRPFFTQSEVAFPGLAEFFQYFLRNVGWKLSVLGFSEHKFFQPGTNRDSVFPEEGFSHFVVRSIPQSTDPISYNLEF